MVNKSPSLEDAQRQSHSRTLLQSVSRELRAEARSYPSNLLNRLSTYRSRSAAKNVFKGFGRLDRRPSLDAAHNQHNADRTSQPLTYRASCTGGWKNAVSRDGAGYGISNEIIVTELKDSVKMQAPRRSLLEARDHGSFVRNIGLTLEYIHPETISEEVVMPKQISRLTDAIDDDIKHLVDLKVAADAELNGEVTEKLLKQLEDGVNHLRSATRELRVYIPESNSVHSSHRRTPSLESLESVVSEKDTCSQVLKVAIQTGYEQVHEQFNDSVQLVTAWLRKEPPVIEQSSISSVTRVTQVVSLLSALVEFETQSHGVDKRQFSLTVSQKLLKVRQQALVELFHALCNHLMFLQESLFLMQHLFAKGIPSIHQLRSMAEVMKSCWKEAREIMKRLTQTCPMFTEIANEYYGRLLWHAASSMASMQDADELQEFLGNHKALPYSLDVVRDTTKAQLWLLPCVDRLRDLITRHARRLKPKTSRSRSSYAPLQKPSSLFYDLKRVLYDLVMTTIARSSWLNSFPDQSSSTILVDLKDQGTRTFALVSNYTRSDVSLKCDQESTVQDVSLYSAMVCATNELRTGVLHLHELVQSREAVLEEPESALFPPESDAIQFHQVCPVRRLKTQISIRPHPVTMEGSLEFDAALQQLEEEKDGFERDHDGSMNWLMHSPWLDNIESLTDESEEGTQTRSSSTTGTPFVRHPSASYASTTPSIEMMTEFAQVDSGQSIELVTEFTDVVPEADSGEVDSAFMTSGAPRRESTRDVAFTELGSKSKSKGSSGQSPFATQQPSERPSPAASTWGVSECPEPSTAQNASDVVSVVSSGLVKDVLAVDLIPGPLIGKGSEGHVLKMSYHTTPVAVKIMNHTSHRTRERFKNETKLLSKLDNHPNIVQFVGQCRDLKAGEQDRAADLVMVMELCDLGNLYKIISEAQGIRQLDEFHRDLKPFQHYFGYKLYTEWQRRLEVARDIAAGAAHMHRNGIVHRDLTSFNVVLKEGEQGTWVAKICDFERSRYIPDNETIPRSDNLANSPAWSAPEVLRDGPYSVQADVFSLGVILWELWTLEEPWKHPEQEIKNPMLIIPEVGNGGRLEIPRIYPDQPAHLSDLKSLIEACWNEDPTARPTMHQVHEKLHQMIEKFSN